MPFENLEIVTRDNMPPTALISYMPPSGRGKSGGIVKHNAKPRLIITLPTTICGTSKSERWALLLGSGADAGKLRVKGLAKGAIAKASVVPSEMKNCFKWNFGFVPKLGEDHFDGERKPVRKISDEEFEIEVPASWFEP